MRRALLSFLILLALGCERRVAASEGPASAVGSAAATAPAVASSAPVAPKAVPEVKLRPGGPRAVEGRFGMVSSEDAHATRIGVEVLKSGGNAIDAAVAVGYALSVTHHAAGSLGGGGFMIVRLANGDTHAIDYREMAPAAATWALNDKQLKNGAHGYLSAPVPGVVAGLDLARERFGTKGLAELVAPSIALAEEGHPYSARGAQILSWHWKELKKDPVFRAVFGRGDRKDKPIGQGQVLVQASLARTLQAIAAEGDAGFYQGEVAAKIAAAMKARGGLVTTADLAAYRAKIREPLHLAYRGLDVFTMPPPSMGGIALYSIMMGLGEVKAHETPVGSALSLHYFAEASRRAYADRRSIGADPDRFDLAAIGPLRDKLLGAEYYASRVPPIGERATPSKDIVPIAALAPEPVESTDTTHFSVVDKDGNAVACTTTLSAAFGAQVVVPETGILLSNAMGAFSPSGVNQLEPGKRMASSMTPTIVVWDGEAAAVMGSPGGDTIPNTVAWVLRNLVDYGMTIDEAIDAGRVHHQYKPDVLRLEKSRAPAPKVVAELRKLGHTVDLNPVPLGALNGIVIDVDTGVAWGFADPRKGGLALGPSSR